MTMPKIDNNDALFQSLCTSIDAVRCSLDEAIIKRDDMCRHHLFKVIADLNAIMERRYSEVSSLPLSDGEDFRTGRSQRLGDKEKVSR
jgi:hypothetical protein